MPLWVDKYRPESIQELSCHSQLTDRLDLLAKSDEFPHVLLYGPPGAGKKTRVNCLLRILFGPGVEKIKIDSRVFQTPSGKKIDVHLVTSNFHIEITPSDSGMYDRVIIQELIKEIAQTQQVDSLAKRSFKVVVLNEADGLTKDAQHALRRTMEKYMANMRVIMVCNSTSKILAPIRSRCFLIRVPAPQNDEIIQVLDQVCSREKLELPSQLANRIAAESKGNLRRALLILETCRVQSYPFSPTQELVPTDWESFIHQIAVAIISEQSPAKLVETRGKLYDLLSHCIPADVIMKTLSFELINLSDDMIKRQIIECAAEYEHRLRLGQKAIFHLEAFVAKFMFIYKKYLMDMGLC